MNTNDFAKASLGKYGVVHLSVGAEFSLIGSDKYVIGAIQKCVDYRTGGDLDILCSCSSDAKYMGSHHGGNIVAQFSGYDINATDNTIKIPGKAFSDIKIGDTCQYFLRGQTDATTPTGLTTCNAGTDITATIYYVIAKNERAGTIQLSTSSGGSASSLTTPATPVQAGTKRALVFPAIVAQTEALIVDAFDGDDDNCGAYSNGTIIYGGQDGNATADLGSDNFPQTGIVFGEWNYVAVGTAGADTNNFIVYIMPKS